MVDYWKSLVACAGKITFKDIFELAAQFIGFEFGKILEEVFLFFVQIGWGFDVKQYDLVTASPVTQGGYALTAQPLFVARLGPFAYIDRFLADQGRNRYFVPQGRLHKRNRHLADYVCIVPFKKFMGLDMNINVKIPRWSAV